MQVTFVLEPLSERAQERERERETNIYKHVQMLPLCKVISQMISGPWCHCSVVLWVVAMCLLPYQAMGEPTSTAASSSSVGGKETEPLGKPPVQPSLVANVAREKLSLKKDAAKEQRAITQSLTAAYEKAKAALESADATEDAEWVYLLRNALNLSFAWQGDNYSMEADSPFWTKEAYDWTSLANEEAANPTLAPPDGSAAYAWKRMEGETERLWHQRVHAILLRHILSHSSYVPIEDPEGFVPWSHVDELIAAVDDTAKVQAATVALTNLKMQMGQLIAYVKQCSADVAKCRSARVAAEKKRKREADKAKQSELLKSVDAGR